MATKKTPKNQSKKNSIIAENTVFTITISWKQAKAAYDQALAKEARRVKLAGFRQGKVPPHIAEKKLGRLHLVNHALDLVLPAAYAKGIEDNKLKPVVQPEIKPISLEWEKDWQLEVTTAEQPELELKNYNKVISATRKEALKEIEKAEKAAKKSSPKTADTKKKEKAGEESHAGHDHHDHDHSQQQRKNQILQAVLKGLVEHYKPAIPELLIKQQAERELKRLQDQLNQMQISLDDYMSRRKVTQEQLSQELAATGLAQLQTDLILTELIQEEKIEVTDSDIEKMLGKRKKTDPPLQGELKQMVEDSIQRQKIIDFLAGE